MRVAEEWRKKGAEVTTIDGVHIQTEDFWVHLRKSNTEPVVRVIAEVFFFQYMFISFIAKIVSLAQ